MIKHLSHIIYFTCLINVCATLYAQELSVKNIEENPFFLGASVDSVKDGNGNLCAKVCVSAPGLEGCTFKGTVYIEQEGVRREGANYILYMPAGEKYLYMQHKDFEDMTIKFGDYNISRLVAKRTYKIMVNVPDWYRLGKESTAHTQDISVNPIQILPGDLTLDVGNVVFKMIYVKGGQQYVGVLDRRLLSNRTKGWKAVKAEVSDFYIGETEVTQALWQAVMGTGIEYQRDITDPSYRLHGVGGNYPMYNVSFEDCMTFIAKLNKMMSGKLGNYRFRLPTELEWEYAARGGQKISSYNGIYSGSDKASDVAWCGDRLDTSPVKKKKPNSLGIYDMSGNVAEWCVDYYNENSGGPLYKDYFDPVVSGYKVVRGGDYFREKEKCLVWVRDYEPISRRSSQIGMRLVLSDIIIPTGTANQ